MIKIGLIGKTNTGKTTFFNSATLMTAETSTYPFTTKKPNVGRAYVQTLCVHKELDVEDNPQNSLCMNGWRFIPIELIDLPGLIKGAWRGKGLGTRFLSVAVEADALLHIVDASGSIDTEGNLTRPGMGNPILDVIDIEEEFMLWFAKMVQRGSKRIIKEIKETKRSEIDVIAKNLSGLKVRRDHVKRSMDDMGLEDKMFGKWTQTEMTEFSRKLREYSKPTLIIANKMDIAQAEKNLEKLREEFRGRMVIPSCSEAELALRRAEEGGFIEYVPGEEVFRVKDKDKLTKDQRWALNYVEQRVFSRFMRTGVQFALNMCVFKLLGMNVVYPVEDQSNLSDKRGNILPDAFIVPPDYTAKDLAEEIHSDLAKTMIYAVDARSNVRLPVDYFLRDRDIIKIVSARARASRKQA